MSQEEKKARQIALAAAMTLLGLSIGVNVDAAFAEEEVRMMPADDLGKVTQPESVLPSKGVKWHVPEIDSDQSAVKLPSVQSKALSPTQTKSPQDLPPSVQMKIADFGLPSEQIKYPEPAPKGSDNEEIQKALGELEAVQIKFKPQSELEAQQIKFKPQTGLDSQQIKFKPQSELEAAQIKFKPIPPK